MALATGLLLIGAAGYAQTFDPDYSRRIPLTIKNNGTAATPSPTSVEAVIPLDAANMRADRLDVRVGYWNGTTLQEIDSKIFRHAALTPPGPLTRNLSAGKTDYNALPTGEKLAISGQDDASTVVTLPFEFPFVDTYSNRLVIGVDGYVAPGTSDPGRNDDPAAARGARIIMPWSSDYDSSGVGQGVWFATDNAGPGGSQRAIVRWELQASGGATLVGRFALILTPDGNIRFVYGDPVVQPNVNWSPLKMGVGMGDLALSMIDTPTEAFTNHADILFTQQLGAVEERVRAVFRLQAPIAAGATSTGQYFILYGNASPSTTVARDIKNIFDHVVDFTGAQNVIGQPAPDWDVVAGNTVTVEQYTGTDANGVALPTAKVGVLRRGTANHPHASVKASAMPAFLNAELLARVAAKGNGDREMAPMLRTVSNPSDENFQGGYGYAVDGFGTPGGSHIVSYVGTTKTAEPATMAGVSDPIAIDQWENILFRIEGTPGILQGKNWTEGSEQPLNWMLKVDRALADPKHGSASDPPWNSPGTTGMGGYLQEIAMDYIALRELRNVTATAGAVQAVEPAGPFIQGTITSSSATLNPLTIATVNVTGPGGYNKTFAVGPDGKYRVSLPAGGAYTVTASALYHTTTSAENVSPSASGQTNITLPYVGATVTGVVRDAITNARVAGATILVANEAGHLAGSTSTNAQGAYTLLLATGGNYRVGAVTATGLGDQKVVTAAPAATTTVDLDVRVVANGNMELPTASETGPAGWSTQEFNGNDTAKAFLYSQAQNRTPGGKWSIAIEDSGETSAWNPPNGYELPVLNSVFNVTVSVWVYFTAPGQKAALRLRDNFPTTGSTTAGRIEVVAGQANDPGNENQSLATVPVGQWFELRKTAPAGTVLDNDGNLGMNLYGRGPGAGGGADGIIYFDDLTITQTPVAWVTGKVVDNAGTPIANAYVGRLTESGVFEVPTLFSGPFIFSKEDGTFTLYVAQAGPVQVSAWLPTPPASGYMLPDWGYVAANVTAQASGSPTSVNVPVLRATNVADGAAVSAKDTNGTRDITGNLAAAVDNNLATRWMDYGLPSGSPALTKDQTIVFDLKSAQQVDQVEIWWEWARPSAYRISVGSDVASAQPIYATPEETSATAQGLTLDLTPSREGPTHVIDVPDDLKANVRYIIVEPTEFETGLGNYSIIELRALSTTAPLPLTLQDAADIMRIWGGLKAATQGDVQKLDRNGNSALTIEDAIALAKSLQ